jgi:RNA polymerase sigma-70 factor, ECF subfamily
MLDGASDEELMTRVAAGDQPAFRMLMTRHMQRAIRIAQGIVGNATDADDVGQDAFLRVWRAARSFDGRMARFTTWMHQIVVNLAIDRARRPRSEPIDEAGEIADRSPGVLAALIEAEEQAAVRGAMAAMPERQRAAVTLFHFEGLSGRECAQAMNVSEGAFESLLTRARAALKQNVEAQLAGRGRKP